MATFTIDTENNIAAHTTVPTNLENAQAFESEKGLAKLAAEWPGCRLVEIWNSFAGVAPFTELKPVKQFTDRKAAVARIWAAVQRLLSKVKKSPAPAKRTAAQKGVKGATGERSNKKAEVIAMMKRAKGATLAEIVEAMGWQKHTARGFVSILGSKGGETIESSKNAAGERTLPHRQITSSHGASSNADFPVPAGTAFLLFPASSAASLLSFWPEYSSQQTFSREPKTRSGLYSLSRSPDRAPGLSRDRRCS